MSRAINVSVAPNAVAALCTKNSVPISAIEALPSGGTRVVFMNKPDTVKMSALFKRQILSGTVVRSPFGFVGR